MTVTASYLKTHAPALASLSDAQCEKAITEAYLQMDEDTWGDLYDTGAFYLAAHIATVAALRGTTAGAIQSESVGQVSRSYAAAVSEDIGSTSFGAEYRRLVSNLIDARMPVIMGRVVSSE